MLPLKLICAIGFLFYFKLASAEHHEHIPHAPQNQPDTSPWYLDTGIRYWLGKSNFKWNLYDIVGEKLLSRLTYQDIKTSTAEGFWRLNHQSGIFFKGYVGAGSNIGGNFFDEDFSPAVDIYSQTQSDQKYGRLSYLSIDLGYHLFQSGHYRLSPFMGYHYWFTHYNSFGCEQKADNPDICATFSFSNATDILNDNASWNSLRLGINGEIQLLENLNFVLDAAYIYAYLLGHDFHNLRPDIRGEFFEGTGNGAQIDMAFNWLATSNFSMGIGARWWTVKTTGHAHFEETAVQGRPQYINTTQNNYGIMIQSQYQFDENKQQDSLMNQSGKNSSLKHWDGLFLGANLGYGASFNNASILPFASTPESIADASPLLVHLQSSGFLGGGQIGYHWTHNNLLLGIESDIDYAAVAGTNSVTFTPYPYIVNSSVTQQLNWLGTVRAKLGKVVSDTLLPYLTAGFSYANTELSYADSALFIPLNQSTYTAYSRIQTHIHWVAGAGLEYAVSDHFHYKIEYLYLNAGHLKLDTPYYGINSNFTNNILRLGINYYL
ncbi:MAG: outer membrane beta-barrel protein [Legionellaceae bacterium]|nr:outer membrane beta-barrel protein [Legionellaceae bacterium]